ncbi:hypothetical protein [Parapedobacter koreensis]|uniref:Uncharacterized protein n=1 Tax=Parapedobacter koreensis TaxID=332977 RepID=A0A1H7R1K7_9SPHI|nr:hypothetical protein [Parapedobacter koreensis]SEL53457.1 hypothetical protein SAMN05421740_106195 [Parapedobacter koreensis]
MIVTTIKKSERKPAGSFVNISRMDYELVLNVLRLLEETGMDDEELSFLLGKRNQYFFDVIDPRKKQKLKTDQVDPLAAIMGKPHREIMPLDIKPDEMIQLHHATRKVNEENNTITYSHIVYPQDGGDGIKIIWQKTFVTGVRRKVNDAVHAFLEEKIGAGYFAKPRLALTVYLELKDELTADSLSAADLEKSLAVLTRTGGPLMRSKIDTQLHYHKNLLFSNFVVSPLT